MKIKQFAARLGQASMLIGALVLSAAASAQNPYERGPVPTTASLEATAGPFTVASFTVSSPKGYGGGTVYYPTNAGGTVGAIAVVPGISAPQFTISWWGPRLASHGFVVITIDTKSLLDFDAARSVQQLAALDQVAALSRNSSSPIYNKVDTTRMGVMGWSMGGGGTLVSAKKRSALKAAVPMAPGGAQSNFSSITVPTLIIACELDTVVANALFSIPYYNSMTRNAKQYLEIAGGSHLCPSTLNGNQTLMAKKGVAWMKRFMDNDTRYTSFACGNPNSSAASAFATANCS